MLLPRRLAIAACVLLTVAVPTVVTGTSVSAVTPTCGGTTLYKANGTAWTCTFADEFSGTSLNTGNWVVQTTAASSFSSGEQDCFVNNSKNVSVANGVLSLTTRRESARFTCSDPAGSYRTQFTSGMVMSMGKFSQTYGRFEVRAKFPATTVAGLQSTLWMWPNNATKYGAWPKSGEIDIAEVYSANNDRVIPYVHYKPSSTDLNVTNNYCMLNPAVMHTYTLVWTSSTLTISFDGKVCVADTWKPAWPLLKPAPFNQPFFMALTQGLGTGPNAFDPMRTPLPATTQIDYVRAWK